MEQHVAYEAKIIALICGQTLLKMAIVNSKEAKCSNGMKAAWQLYKNDILSLSSQVKTRPRGLGAGEHQENPRWCSGRKKKVIICKIISIY